MNTNTLTLRNLYPTVMLAVLIGLAVSVLATIGSAHAGERVGACLIAPPPGVEHEVEPPVQLVRPAPLVADLTVADGTPPPMRVWSIEYVRDYLEARLGLPVRITSRMAADEGPCITITVSGFDHNGEWEEIEIEVCNNDELLAAAGNIELLPRWGFVIVDITLQVS